MLHKLWQYTRIYIYMAYLNIVERPIASRRRLSYYNNQRKVMIAYMKTAA